MNIRFIGDWYIERLTQDEVHGHRVKKRLAKVKTRFQTAEVVDTLDYGRCLYLDGLVQSTEVDEFIYHEALIHPALILHPKPESVFIAGGGEGAPLREALKHPSVKRIVMVEIDDRVVSLSKKYLKSWHQEAFNDRRVRLVFDDVRAFIEREKEAYDCIFLDLCDPGEGGPAQKLFTVEFYRLVRSCLKERGIVVIQAGSSNFNMIKGFANVYHTLKKIFRQVLPYQACVPSYVGSLAFFLCRKNISSDYLDAKRIGREVRNRHLTKKLKFYSPSVHIGLFALPPYFSAMLKKGKAIADKRPLFIRRKDR